MNLDYHTTPVNADAARALSHGQRQCETIKDALKIFSNILVNSETEEAITKAISKGLNVEYRVTVQKRTQGPGFNAAMVFREKTSGKTVAHFSELIP